LGFGSLQEEKNFKPDAREKMRFLPIQHKMVLLQNEKEEAIKEDLTAKPEYWIKFLQEEKSSVDKIRQMKIVMNSKAGNKWMAAFCKANGLGLLLHRFLFLVPPRPDKLEAKEETKTTTTETSTLSSNTSTTTSTTSTSSTATASPAPTTTATTTTATTTPITTTTSSSSHGSAIGSVGEVSMEIKSLLLSCVRALVNTKSGEAKFLSAPAAIEQICSLFPSASDDVRLQVGLLVASRVHSLLFILSSSLLFSSLLCVLCCFGVDS
jgi:hypothetical protein